MTPPAVTLDARSAHATRSAPPLVLIDGRCVDSLWPLQLKIAAPLDRRSARLAPDRQIHALNAAERARTAEWVGRAVGILQPLELNAGEVRWLPLFSGRITGIDQQTAASNDALTLRAESDWDRTLDRTWNHEHLADSDRTLGDWLDAINRHENVTLDTRLLPADMLDRAVSAAVGYRATLVGVLESLCNEFGMTVDTQPTWDGHRITHHPTLRLDQTARPVRISPLVDGQTDRLESLTADHPSPRPIQWIARAEGQVVESTFTLLAGWDPDGEGQPDAVYQKSANADFDRVANVYRLWVLNEDGAFGDPPFDLTALFADGRAVPPQPLRFANTLTLSAEGRTLGPVVEISTDAGSTWSRYPGQAQRLTDRAGIYLNDDALPAAFLSAAQSDQARVRITATLQSPLPIEQVRWIGNPFAGDFEQRVIRFGDRFVYRRVDSTSRYHDAVRNGTFTADECDSRTDMRNELIRRAAAARPPDAPAVTTVLGPQLGLRLGDQPSDLVGCDVGAALTPPSVVRPIVRLRRIEHRWTDHRSVLTWGE